MQTTKTNTPATRPAKKQRQTVDEFMDALDHPFKAEVQAVRGLIKGVNSDITEGENNIAEVQR
jgi:hypothetical protein